MIGGGGEVLGVRLHDVAPRLSGGLHPVPLLSMPNKFGRVGLNIVQKI